MNLSIFSNPDPSGKLSKESFLIKNYPEEYEYVVSFCETNNIYDVPFKEKVYLAINKIEKLPICKSPICKSRVNFKNSSLGYYDYCSNECVGKDPIIISKKKQTSIINFGCEVPQKSDIVKEKSRITNNKKYSADSPLLNKEVKEKAEKTLMKNWGVKNPSQSKELVEKRVENFKQSNYKENFKNSSLEKFGVEHPWMNEEIHRKTVLSGIDYRNKTTSERVNSLLEKYPKHKLIDIDFESDGKVSRIECPESHEFCITRQLLYERTNNLSEICTLCNPISKGISGQEICLLNFIRENYNGIIIQNDRSVINPKEIDIFLPELNLGIEFNGLWWHSVKNKDKNYHRNKWETCCEKNIDLITIWADDWSVRNEICKSFILNKLGKSKKIFARKCYVKEIDYREAKTFLNENHLQGDCKSSIRCGLYEGDELVSIMTFSNLRLSVGRKNTDKRVFELVRFCNKRNHTVVGGASKLLTYFIKNYSPHTIETYSDNMISNGNLYERLGFGLSHITKPGYYYLIGEEKRNRFNFRKDLLVKQGFDKSKTEEEIMMERGYFRLYNSGNKKWVLHISQNNI